MTTYNLYGLRFADLEQATMQIEAALGVKFQRHESDYRGGDYFRFESVDESGYILQRNVDLIDNAPAIERFSQFPILFYVKLASERKNHCELLSDCDFEFVFLYTETETRSVH